MRRVVVSQGDPEGVGPELLCHAAAQGLLRAGDHVVAGRAVLQRVADTVDRPWARSGWAALQPLLPAHDALTQVEALELAVDRVLEDPGAALVTAPLDKARAKAEGFEHPGHTEYLAARAGTPDYAMGFFGPRLRVVLATIHVPLSAVPGALSSEQIARVGTLFTDALRSHVGVARPVVGVLGLNPHAGERGLLGREDEEVIAPAVEALRARYGERAEFRGPLPADTAFHQHAEGMLDGLVAMYHDQGLAPFKLVHFHDGVNVTLGLPFVRASPDHGTARDIAFTGRVDPRSFEAAIRYARGDDR